MNILLQHDVAYVTASTNRRDSSRRAFKDSIPTIHIQITITSLFPLFGGWGHLCLDVEHRQTAQRRGKPYANMRRSQRAPHGGHGRPSLPVACKLYHTCVRVILYKYMCECMCVCKGIGVGCLAALATIRMVCVRSRANVHYEGMAGCLLEW